MILSEGAETRQTDWQRQLTTAMFQREYKKKKNRRKMLVGANKKLELENKHHTKCQLRST